MILRRVIEHFRRQEWTAIGIDFVIVVFGVFFGIQVANWNEMNSDRRIADKYLADIAADIRSDLVELAGARDSAMARIGASSYILRQAGLSAMASGLELTQLTDNAGLADFERITVPDVEAPVAERRNQLWSMTTAIYMYDTNRSAYDALVSSGRVDLIEDPRMKGALREYYYLVNALTTSQLRTIAPLRDQIVAIGMARGHSFMGVTDEATLAEQVGNDPAFAASVATSRELAIIHMQMCTALEKKAHVALQLLEAGQP